LVLSAKCLELFLGELVDKAVEVATKEGVKTLSAAHMCALHRAYRRVTCDRHGYH